MMAGEILAPTLHCGMLIQFNSKLMCRTELEWKKYNPVLFIFLFSELNFSLKVQII
jgi:hypothetical protein